MNLPTRQGAGLMALLFVAACFCLLAIACQAPEPSDQDAISFAAVAQADKAEFQPSGYLVISAPERRDYLAINRNFDSQEDVLVGLDLADFMQAGLDPARLDPADFLPGTPVYDLPTSTLLISFDLGTAAFEPGRYNDQGGKPLTEINPRVLMAEIKRQFRALVSFDPGTGLNSLALGKVAVLSWAQAPQLSDPDLVFSVDPAPLVKAGLDIAKLQVWKVFPAAAAGSAGSKLILAYKLL